MTARSAIAEAYAKKAQEKRLEKDWASAWQNLSKARSWQVNAPEVLRAYADLLAASRSDDLTLLQVLRALESVQQSTNADRLKVGQILISLGHIHAARAEYEKLSLSDQQKPEGMRLLAQLLQAEGQPEAAEELLRRALSMAPSDAESQLRLAMMDHHQTFPEVQSRARKVIWEIARQTNLTGLTALDFLASTVQLTGEEAAELLRLVEAHPSAPPGTRYAALSARLRARPQDRAAIMEKEVAAVRGQGVEMLAPALNWLLQEKEPAKVLNLLPEGLHLKSGPILQSYLVALSALDRWNEIDNLLHSSKILPLSEAYLHLWKARTADKQDTGIQTIRHHLEAAFAQTRRGEDETAARLTAETAEQMGIWDLASRFYAEVAALQPYNQSFLLEKIHEMALRGRDTTAALNSARKQAITHPENHVYTTRAHYLSLLSGDEIEVTIQATRQLPSSQQESPAVILMKALADFRLGDETALRARLAHPLDSSVLPPGQRATYAGLLSICGQVGPAFRLAESIPGILLLPEEMRFLKRAL
ncbi:tetratricopeptide repeat protein [Prosthecobacter dejongeii]|uniref:Tetratricopeptide (TPR) repeat protein n=1 Tax=Prosthecobacter dejongeii TaxID=48465 RepID=A0A7W8DRL5_9BACT|nr:tetratricopeptide repeat protein [Prosthecobacter dejongeii]MBB5039618.1 tetratricopeptide (TPR) repeat protein [Prosthecobacter dejongeii]